MVECVFLIVGVVTALIVTIFNNDDNDPTSSGVINSQYKTLYSGTGN